MFFLCHVIGFSVLDVYELKFCTSRNVAKKWNKYYLSGVHVNVSDQVNGNPDFVLTVHHLKAWERDNGPIPHNSVILVNFGWAHKFGNRQSYYSGLEEPYRWRITTTIIHMPTINNNMNNAYRNVGVSGESSVWKGTVRFIGLFQSEIVSEETLSRKIKLAFRSLYIQTKIRIIKIIFVCSPQWFGTPNL